MPTMMSSPYECPVIMADGTDVAIARSQDMMILRSAHVRRWELQVRPMISCFREYGLESAFVSGAPEMTLDIQLVASHGEFREGGGAAALRRMLPACQLTIRELLQIVHEKASADIPGARP